MNALSSPVFILGLHRSGTTLLYQMLAASGCFHVVTARHVIQFDGTARAASNPRGEDEKLTSRFARLGLTTRLVDDVNLTPNLPEEYGFVLEAAWGRPTLDRRTLPTLVTLCEGIAGESRDVKLMLLKNPWDFSRFRAIRKLLPGARFVFIHRRPLHVVASMYRLLTDALSRRNEYLCLINRRYSDLMNSEFPLRTARWFCDRRSSWVAAGLIAFAGFQSDRYLRDRSRLPPESAIDIRFEDLCRRPDDVIKAILRRFGIKDRGADSSRWIKSPRREIPTEVAALSHQIERRLGRYAAALGYDI